MRFLKSFLYAFRGIVYCINNERNMRIHTVVALYVFVFSFFFHLTRGQYAVLCLTFGLVMMAELFNTVGEELCDLVAASFHPVVRIIKDMAAGAVLLCAIASVGVAVCLFWRPAVFETILLFFGERPWLIAVLALSAVLSVVFVVLGPLGIRDLIHRKNYRSRLKR